jgi:NAD(P)-dependent dehydrogenase (short-subunit alcohol dehydrogenase family)
LSARVLITGAGGGIGTSATAELHARGAEVVGLDLAPGDDGLIHCDVRDQESVNDAVHEAVKRLGGGLDVLINNAGLGDPQSAGAPPDKAAEAVIDVNLWDPGGSPPPPSRPSSSPAGGSSPLRRPAELFDLCPPRSVGRKRG